MVSIFVEGKSYAAREGTNLLSALLSLGFDVPYFCWHPALHSVGACRQCAVRLFKDEKDAVGRIVMSCMTPVNEGMRLSVDDPEALRFRRGVIEWLMLNHPHDCPVCDEGGECHLQDMTVLTGHDYRRSRFRKRTYRNQDLGPFVNHEMNRCIQCYRCVRFYRDYAGGRDMNVFAAHDSVYFGRAEDGALENPFSGNLVEICPTGVFTDKVFKKRYSRSWDLRTAPSVCVHCGLGCNTFPGERYGTLRRIRTRYNREVNGCFLCDRGRFGYGFGAANGRGSRALPPLRRERQSRSRRAVSGDSAPALPLAAAKAVEGIAGVLSASRSVIGIGSPRASMESNFALRALVGPGNFVAGFSSREWDLLSLVLEVLQGSAQKPAAARAASLSEAERSDAVLVLGEDPLNTAPLLELALRQTAMAKARQAARALGVPHWNDHPVREIGQHIKAPLFLVTPYRTSLSDVSEVSVTAGPDGIAQIGHVLARAIDPGAPGGTLPKDSAGIPVDRIARALLEAERPLVVSGTACASSSVIKAAANVARALTKSGKDAGIILAVPECNSLGLALLGGMSLDEAFARAEKKRPDALVVVENDLYRRASKRDVEKFLRRCAHVVVIDHFETATAAEAEHFLPAATFAEGSGTLVNNEGRCQRFFRVLPPVSGAEPDTDPAGGKEPDRGKHPPAQSGESWKWIRDIMAAAGKLQKGEWENLDAIIGSMVTDLPRLAAVSRCAPGADFRSSGMKVPRDSHRCSGRTSMDAHVSIHERKPPDDGDTPLCFSMEGADLNLPPALIPRYWAPGWNSVQALNKFQREVGGELIGGETGACVFEGAGNPGGEPSVGRIAYYPGSPLTGERKVPKGDFFILPCFHVFGSEELSAAAEGIASRAPRAYIGLSKESAERMGLSEGAEARVVSDVEGRSFSAALPVRLIPGLPQSCALLPVGLPGTEWLDLPARGRVSVPGTVGSTESRPAKRRGQRKAKDG
jgi:NADH-quinone oxidoreductase subunit G